MLESMPAAEMAATEGSEAEDDDGVGLASCSRAYIRWCWL